MSVKSAIKSIQTQIESISESIKKGTTTNWEFVSEKLQDSVVQLISIKSHFNWLNPHNPIIGSKSSGSAFFIDESGLIITNYHVIDESIEQYILIPSMGKTQFKVEIVGISPERDIALLKLTKEAKMEYKKKINFLHFGNSDKVKRFQETVALGFPLGQDKLKATRGSVSGRQRLGYFGYIQIDTPINPGNSGGPSINKEGKVIGINSRGIPGAQSVGYIIPINEVKMAIKDLKSGKTKLIRNPSLGAIFLTPSDTTYKFHKNKSGGRFITKLFNNSILKTVGVKEGDFLLKVNGYVLDKYGDLNVNWTKDKISLFELLNRYKEGASIPITIIRNGYTKEKTLHFKQSPVPIRTIYPRFESEDEFEHFNFGGMILMNLKLNHISFFSLLGAIPFNIFKYTKYENQDVGAVLITKIFPTSIASKMDELSPGTVLKSVNGIKIKGLGEFKTALNKTKKVGIVEIITKNNYKVYFDYAEVVKGEDDLVKKFKYTKMI